MKYKINDMVFIDWVGIREAKITGSYPNTNRYKIIESGYERFIGASEVFETRKQVLEKRLEIVEIRIKRNQKERDYLLKELS